MKNKDVTAEIVKKDPPKPTFKYLQDDKEKTILMTFGLISELAEAIGDLQKVLAIGIDFSLNEIILSRVLTLDDKNRPHPKEYDPYIQGAGIAFKDLQDMLVWVAAHLLDFFIGSLQQSITTLNDQKIVVEDLTQKMKDLMPSSTGLPV